MSANPPRFQEESTLTAREVIEASSEDPQYLLVSEPFYELEDHLAFAATQLVFFNRFYQWIEKLSQELGGPTVHTYGWGDFPEDSAAFYLADWTADSDTYRLGLEHQDRELPLMITFAKLQAPEST